MEVFLWSPYFVDVSGDCPPDCPGLPGCCENVVLSGLMLCETHAEPADAPMHFQATRDTLSRFVCWNEGLVSKSKTQNGRLQRCSPSDQYGSFYFELDRLEIFWSPYDRSFLISTTLSGAYSVNGREAQCIHQSQTPCRESFAMRSTQHECPESPAFSLIT